MHVLVPWDDPEAGAAVRGPQAASTPPCSTVSDAVQSARPDEDELHAPITQGTEEAKTDGRGTVIAMPRNATNRECTARSQQLHQAGVMETAESPAALNVFSRLPHGIKSPLPLPITISA